MKSLNGNISVIRCVAHLMNAQKIIWKIIPLWYLRNDNLLKYHFQWINKYPFIHWEIFFLDAITLYCDVVLVVSKLNQNKCRSLMSCMQGSAYIKIFMFNLFLITLLFISERVEI